MMRLIVQACLLIALFSAYGEPTYSQSADEPAGSICGIVQDENGAPASLVRVVASYLGLHNGIEPMGQADKSGHYCVTHLSLGDYSLSADDPEKGYPPMESSFYSSQPSDSKVSIKPHALEGHADFRIPYKAGFLKVQLTDARTGKQILPMFFNLVVRSRPDDFLRGSSLSTMALLLPPNEDVYFTVGAQGYKEWPGDGTNGKLMNMLPGATEELAIALQPVEP